MRDHANNDFRPQGAGRGCKADKSATTTHRDRSWSGVLSRLLAHVRQRMTRSERKLGGLFRAYRDADGNDYIAPVPCGALPMSKRRAR